MLLNKKFLFMDISFISVIYLITWLEKNYDIRDYKITN